MYINRAKGREYETGQLNTPGVRKYYTVIKPELLNDPIDICAKFDRILKIWSQIQVYPLTKLLLKFNENFKLFLISYLFRVPEQELSEQSATPIMESLLRLFALLEVGDFGFSSRYFKTFLFNYKFKLVDKEYSIESIISYFDNHINTTWQK